MEKNPPQVCYKPHSIWLIYIAIYNTISVSAESTVDWICMFSLSLHGLSSDTWQIKQFKFISSTDLDPAAPGCLTTAQWCFQ